MERVLTFGTRVACAARAKRVSHLECTHATAADSAPRFVIQLFPNYILLAVLLFLQRDSHKNRH